MGGRGLQRYDVSNASQPSKQGEVIDSGGGVALAISGSYLYVAGTKGLLAYNIEDPKKSELSPAISKIETGVLSATAGAALTVVGSVLYVAGQYGLAYYDISAPENPSKVG